MPPVISALVTRWRKIGWTGRSGPERCTVHVSRSPDGLTLRLEAGGRYMLVLLDERASAELLYAVMAIIG